MRRDDHMSMDASSSTHVSARIQPLLKLLLATPKCINQLKDSGTANQLERGQVKTDG